MDEDLKRRSLLEDAPASIKGILEEILTLEEPTVVRVSRAVRRLEHSKPRRSERGEARELLISAVKLTGVISAPAQLVDQYLDTRKKPKPAPAPVAAPEEDGVWPEWPDGVALGRNKYGDIQATLANALLYVRYCPALRGRLVYNERDLRAEWTGAGRLPWNRDGRGASVTEDDAVEAAAWITQSDGVGFGKEQLLSAFLAEARQRQYDPVKAYLDGLEWDGTERIDRWLVDHFGAAEVPYVISVGRSWLISAVARVYEPGCKVDHMLILEGPQAYRKSEGLNALVGDDWYAEVSLDPTAKDSMQDIHGPWIVEWSELSGLSKREANALKAFLTRKVDRFRAPYGRSPENHPRRCVFSGTTNEGQYLTDTTGGRRYWPVRVTRKASPAALADIRDQLWAEAVALYRDGYQWWLSDEQESEAAEVQRSKLVEDTWDDRIGEWLTGRIDTGFIPTSEILTKALELPSSAQGTATSKRLKAAMERLGWEPARQRIAGIRMRGFLPVPEPTEDDDEVPF
jgi:predicted P-loop ATPase